MALVSNAGNTALTSTPNLGQTSPEIIEFQWSDILAAGFDLASSTVSFDLAWSGSEPGDYLGIAFRANTSTDPANGDNDGFNKGATVVVPTTDGVSTNYTASIADLVPFLNNPFNTYPTTSAFRGPKQHHRRHLQPRQLRDHRRPRAATLVLTGLGGLLLLRRTRA